MTPTDRDYAGYSEDDLEQTLIWKHRQESSLYGRRKNYWKGKHPLEWAVFFFTVLAFVAAASAALYTRNEVVVMHDQEQRQLRGYVYATVKGPFVIGQKGTFPVQFDILGQTPVYHVHIVMNGGSSCSGVFQFQGKAWKKDMFVDVLFPGDDDVWNEMDFPISKNDIQQMRFDNVRRDSLSRRFFPAAFHDILLFVGPIQ
jgi:hypothetical protein